MTLCEPAMSYMDSLKCADWLKEEVSTGTSIMAVEFDGGVVIGADSRTTSGPYIANRVTDKLTRVSDYIYCCRSGSAADTQAITDIVSYHVELLGIEMGQRPLVSTAANVFKELCYSYKDSLTAGILVAGFDEKLGGQVYSIPVGGMLKRQSIAIGGSGSGYIYGYVDANFKEGMSQEQCADLVTKSLALAMQRDGSSGGVIRLAIITKDGVERRLTRGADIPRFNV